MKILLAAVMLCMNAAAYCTTPHAYVTELGGTAVSVIDVNRNTVQKIFGFSNPHVVRVTFDGTEAYVGDINDNIYKISCADHSVSKITTLSGHPIAFCITPDSSTLYAATHNNTVAIIDLTTNTLISEIPGLNGPQDIRATPDGKFIYVTNKGNGTVTVIDNDSKTLLTTILGFQYPVGICFDIDGNYGYITDTHNNEIYVIRLSDNTIVQTILGFSSPSYVAMAPNKTIAYISNRGKDSISILRLSDNFVIGSIPVPNPGSIGVSADGLYIYVASGQDEVFKISTLDNSIQSALSDFKNPSNITFSDNNAAPDTVNGWQVVNNPEAPYNQISWSQPAGTPYQYRIFTDSEFVNLLATVPGTQFLYNDLNVIASQTYSYYVIADYSNGFSITIGGITIDPSRIGLPR